MKFLYETIVYALLFYFFLNVFNGIKVAGASSSLTTNILAGLIFGLFIAGIPSILKFLKLPVNTGATFLMALVVIFLFLFILQQQIGGLGSIGTTQLNLGLGAGRQSFNAIQTMVLATVVISLSVVGLKALSKSK